MSWIIYPYGVTVKKIFSDVNYAYIIIIHAEYAKMNNIYNRKTGTTRKDGVKLLSILMAIMLLIGSSAYMSDALRERGDNFFYAHRSGA